MKNPLVSIVLPTWNRSHLLEGALLCILKQTYKNFEIIVADDGSTDDTAEIMAQLLKKFNDPRIHFIRSEQHIKGAAIRRIAMQAARGDYIASQDDDDFWEPTFLEEQIKNLESLPKEYGLSYVSYWRCLSEKKKVLMPPKNMSPLSGDLYGGPLLKNNYFPFQTGVFRREVLDTVGFPDDKLFALSDWDMWIRIAKKYKIAHIDKPLFTWNYTPKSNTRDPEKIWLVINARKRILEKFKEDIISFGYVKDHMSRLADLLMQAGDSAQARRHLIYGIRKNPLSLILWFKLAATFLGTTGYQTVQHYWRSRKNKMIGIFKRTVKLF